jgi:xylulokinase
MFNTFMGGQVMKGDLYEAMAVLAEKVAPGAEGLLFSPHLGGRICPSDPSMRGAWMGFSWGHNQAHFLRAVLESVAYEYAYYLRILGELIPDLELIEARVIGGGAKNTLWNQIKADVLGVPYQRLKKAEFATWGCALIAGHAVGVYDNLADASEQVAETRGKQVRPRPEVHRVYQANIEKYIGWQNLLKEMVRQDSQD